MLAIGDGVLDFRNVECDLAVTLNSFCGELLTRSMARTLSNV
jgi:hypothetical protein